MHEFRIQAALPRRGVNAVDYCELQALALAHIEAIEIIVGDAGKEETVSISRGARRARLLEKIVGALVIGEAAIIIAAVYFFR